MGRGPAKRVCRPLGSCIDQPLKRGSKRWKCRVCETEFPCSNTCGHLDCAIVRGDSELPLGIVDSEPEISIHLFYQPGLKSRK